MQAASAAAFGAKQKIACRNSATQIDRSSARALVIRWTKLWKDGGTTVDHSEGRSQKPVFRVVSDGADCA
jgi:hypothetical protein